MSFSFLRSSEPLIMDDLRTITSPSTPAVRFSDVLKQPASESIPFELDEMDVVWSASDEVSNFPSTESSPSPAPSSPSAHRRPFRPEKFGLSVAFSDSPRSLLQRKPSLDPSLSAATAARTVPPVPLSRSQATSDDFSRPHPGKFLQSAPLNVPAWPRSRSATRSPRAVVFEVDDDRDADEEMLPPHEIVERSHTATFSVVEGAGRTLKGRDLHRVRNAIWQKTGFLD